MTPSRGLALTAALLGTAPCPTAAADPHHGTLAVVNLAGTGAARVRAVARRLSPRLSSWARSPAVAALLDGDPLSPEAARRDPGLAEVDRLLKRTRAAALPAAAELVRLGRLLAADYLLLVRTRGRRVRANLYSVHMRARAPRGLHTRLPHLAGLVGYVREQTDGGRWHQPGRRPPRDLLALLGADFSYVEMHRSSVRVTPGFWLKTIAGYGRLDVSGLVPDDRINVTRDLGLEEGHAFVGRIEYQPYEGHWLGLGYTPARFGARVVMERAVRINNTPVSIHEMVETDLDLDFFELSYWYDLRPRDFFTVAVGAQVSLTDTRFMIEDLGNTVTGARAKQEKIEHTKLVPVPYLGLRVEYLPVARLGVVSEVKAFTAGSTFTVVDVEVGARFNAFRNLSLFAGYRVAKFDLEVFDQEFHFNIKGPCFHATFHLWTDPFAKEEQQERWRR